MGVPVGVAAIDLMVGVPHDGEWTKAYESLVRDAESRRYGHGAEYMYHDRPDVGRSGYEAVVLGEMDRCNVQLGLIPVTFEDRLARSLLERHPGRFAGSWMVDPNRGMDAVRDLERAVTELGVVAATCFPAGLQPQVPINDRRLYPIYAKCIELDIPICINAGVPGPRFPYECQYVGLLDEVCWFFPELRIVTRHGCEPWEDLAVKLLLKYPNLYYSTSAFAPKYYPKAIVEYANTRGADKVMYAGYFPSGLSLERIFGELPDVPFRDHVWPKFLRENALRVFKLGDRLGLGAAGEPPGDDR